MSSHSTVADAARVVVSRVLALKPGEQFLIVSNPGGESDAIARALFDAAIALGAETTLVFQSEKDQLTFANRAALAAFGSSPDAVASISANKLGKDRIAQANPFVLPDGRKFDHIFNYQLEGLKTLRAVWSPGLTVDMFTRTATIDYDLLYRRCAALVSALDGAATVHVTAPGGTDIRVPVLGRRPMSDDGDFTRAGTGGNIPAGEVFISPFVGKSEGVIVFDGSVSLNDGDLIVREPVRVTVKAGYVESVTGGAEARALLESIEAGERKALEFEREGKLPAGSGASYARNARNLGELGIGLNPAAEIRGNMLEDEKAFHTCHFAIGSNYDDDAEAMIHLDCLVREPTIVVEYPDGKRRVIEEKGRLTDALGGTT